MSLENLDNENIYTKRRIRKFSREYFELVCETLIYVFFVMTFLLQSFVIPTGSMQQNILIGDHLLVNKVAYDRYPGENSIDSIFFPNKPIQRGSIVTFKAPAEMEKEYVKRVIALPGETIRISGKKVYIDGKLLVEPYIHLDEELRGRIGPGDYFPLQEPRYLNVRGKTSYLPFYINDGDGFIDQKRTIQFCQQYKDSVIRVNGDHVFKVPEGHYFCMGDNRDHSYDSRFWGPVPAEYIIGEPWRIYWSFESTTEEYMTPGMGHKIKDIAATLMNFFSRTRWDRTIKKIE